jgi:hypothetical protein
MFHFRFFSEINESHHHVRFSNEDTHLLNYGLRHANFVILSFSFPVSIPVDAGQVKCRSFAYCGSHLDQG